MKVRHWVLGLAVLGSTVYGLSIPDAEGFRNGYLAKILVTHVPCAFLASIFLLASAVYGAIYLRKGTAKFDVRGLAAVELGTVMALLTLVTGILFSWVQWGAPWQNDPRQISFLMVLLLYVALLALRSGFTDPQKRESVTAALSVAMVVPMVFLTFVFPRLPQVQKWSFHPTNTISEGRLDGAYGSALLLSMVVTGWLVWEVFAYRVRVGDELVNRDERNSAEEFGGSAAADVVVRPVAVPRAGEEDGPLR